MCLLALGPHCLFFDGKPSGNRYRGYKGKQREKRFKGRTVQEIFYVLVYAFLGKKIIRIKELFVETKPKVEKRRQKGSNVFLVVQKTR